MDFSARRYRFPGAQEQAVAGVLDLTATTVLRKLNDLLVAPAMCFGLTGRWRPTP